MNVCGFVIDDAVARQAADAANAFGCPPGLVIGMGIVESGGNPDIPPHVDANGQVSAGFLQLNQGGQGAGYSVAQLQDFTTNLAIGVPPLAQAWQQYGPDLWTVLQRSGHPGYPAGRVAHYWTQDARADLGGRTALDFIACAVEALPGPVPDAPPPGYETGPPAPPWEYVSGGGGGSAPAPAAPAASVLPWAVGGLALLAAWVVHEHRKAVA